MDGLCLGQQNVPTSGGQQSTDQGLTDRKESHASDVGWPLNAVYVLGHISTNPEDQEDIAQ